MGERRFVVELIKPSHYDDDGYVIQWWKSWIPSNSHACLYGITTGLAERRALGPGVAIEIHAYDECHTVIPIARIIRRIKSADAGLVCLVGVQSNQFPRAMDLAARLRDAGVQVAVGGFHVSGCLAMLPEMQADLQAALDMGCALFAGEAEDGRLDAVLRDVAAGTLKPIYRYLDELPAIESTPTPYLPAHTVARTLNHHASFDAGRGCPFQCSFCTIINVQGRKSRRRSPDDVERLIRRHYAEGVRRFFITDDNFARNKDWEPIFDRIIELRERDKIDVRLIIQVDTLCHKLPNFVAKAARAGVTRVFIGLENINPANLMAAKKRQNKITEYRKMLLAWKNAGVITFAGYILGFPGDTPQSIREDIEIIKKELPLDVLEFFFLTPLPGSEDHKVAWQKGVWMDADMNKYDLEHTVADHPKMSRAEREEVYRAAWDTYYTREHVETIIRRGTATNMGVSRLQAVLWFFSSVHAVEHLHPMQCGVVRLKYRRDRRPGLPLEPLWTFYPKCAWELVTKHARVFAHWWDLELMVRRARRRAGPGQYMDRALTPVEDDETETLEMFTHNEGARNEVAHTRKVAALTHGTAAVAQNA